MANETKEAPKVETPAKGPETKEAPKVDLLAAAKKAGLKTIKAENLPGVEDGAEVYVYSASQLVSFKFSEKNKHLPGKTEKVNILDAAVMEMQGKGEIVKG